MAKLILQCEDRAAQEYAVEKTVSIGRLADNTVVLDHPSVSSHHACVFADGTQCIVEDLQSTNGTFVNGRRVSRRTLLNGDVVVVGTHKIVFDQLASAEPAAPASAESVSNNGETVFLDNRTLLDRLLVDSDTYRKTEALSARLTELEQNPRIARAAQQAAEAPEVGVLRVVSGATADVTYKLDKHTSLIGKAESSLVRLQGWFKPRVAVAITRNRHGYVATLLGGKTFINSQPPNGVRHELKDGDVLEVSGLILEFRAKAS
jgi:pSer/pThr/pTyr-binding forkhead associated (FHA) protein